MKKRFIRKGMYLVGLRGDIGYNYTYWYVIKDQAFLEWPNGESCLQAKYEFPEKIAYGGRFRFFTPNNVVSSIVISNGLGSEYLGNIEYLSTFEDTVKGSREELGKIKALMEKKFKKRDLLFGFSVYKVVGLESAERQVFIPFENEARANLRGR